MLSIHFYKFSKNKNSTKIPPNTGTTFQCALLEPTGILNPGVALKHENPTEYNYAYIPAFKRYYFVNDWVYSGGRWGASLNVDVMASFRGAIADSTQYVVRSASDFDGSVVDTLYPTKSPPQVIRNTQAPPFTGSCYVVGVVGGGGNLGSTSYYTFTEGGFRAFCSALMNNSSWMTEGIEEISEQLVKAIVNPFQYVVSCMWFPISGFIGGGAGAIQYGWYSLSASANTLATSIYAANFTFPVPHHPQAERGAYLNGSPFVNYTFTWRPFGQFSLPANRLAHINEILCTCAVDAASGVGHLEIMEPGESGAVLLSAQTRIGVPIQLAQVQPTPLGLAMSAVSDAVGQVFGNFAGNIGDAVSSAGSRLQIMGSNGSRYGSNGRPQLITEIYTVADDDPTHRGRPLMRDVQISTLSGFTMCADPELDAPCTPNELDTIKGYMAGGFYYE